MTQTDGEKPPAYPGNEDQMEAIRQKLAPALRDILEKMKNNPLSSKIVEQSKKGQHPKIPEIMVQLIKDIFLWMSSLRQEMNKFFKENEELEWGDSELCVFFQYIFEKEQGIEEVNSETEQALLDILSPEYEQFGLTCPPEMIDEFRNITNDNLDDPHNRKIFFDCYCKNQLGKFLDQLMEQSIKNKNIRVEQNAFRVAFETSYQLLNEQLKEFFEACGSYTEDIQSGDDIPVPAEGCSAEMRSNIERYNQFNQFSKEWCGMCAKVIAAPPEKFHERLEVFHTAKAGLELSMPKEIKMYANAVMELFDWIRSKLTKTEGKDAPSCFTTKAYNVWCQAARIGTIVDSKEPKPKQTPGSKLGR